MNSSRRILITFAAVLAIFSCSTTRTLKDGEYLLRSNKIRVNDKTYNASDLSAYLLQKPNAWMLGTSPSLVVYNWGGEGKNAFQRLFQKIGTAPVVYDASKVDETIDNITNHLRFTGYYGSVVESDVRVSGRKVYVTYYVALGKRYKISAIDYDIPSYGTFRKDWDEDSTNVSIKKGMYLSEEVIEKEADRSSAYFRTKGYYGFNKSYYLFEADTLAGNGDAKLTMSIRDYALGDSPLSAREHKKYTIGNLTVTKPQRLRIRPGVIETLNILRPGELYNEKDINTTYTRFSNVNMLTGVSITTSEAPGDKVDCNIALRNSGLQGFKVNLEASVNSTALFGISPQLTYYHRNIFHGGEVLNLGVKGSFQFRPKSDAYSTEVSTTASIQFPKFIGLPTRLFKGRYIPKSEVSIAFNYQDRPEFKRTAIAGEFSYTGRFNSRFSYKFTPLRVNVTRLFDASDAFSNRLIENIVLAGAYMDKFDMGISTMLYYTTDNSVVPTTPYHYIRFNMDLSGNVLSLFNNILPMDEYGERTIWSVPYTQYVKGEVHLGKTFRFGKQDKQALALHFTAGAGFPYGNSANSSIPLEKLFYVGGAYSMRGWQARTLGPGTSTFYSTMFVIPSAVGEIKMEANAEYRFPIFWKFEGAVFADAGNIWDFPDSYNSEDSEDAELLAAFEDGSAFNFTSSTLKGIGLDWGFGLRLNLGLILVRVDTGFRIHDPGKEEGQRWLGPAQWFDGNYAIHFGVGYPF